MKIVFFGTPEWAVPSLRSIVRSHHEIVGVVTAPDKAVGRSRVKQATAIKQAARECEVGPVFQPETLRGAARREEILGGEPDALVVVAYGKILPGRLLDAPRYGAINLHFSLLPRHRGASPVHYAVLCGDRRSGVSTMQMDRGLDTGAILLQEECPLDDQVRSVTLGPRLADLGAALIVRTLDGVEAGSITPRRQNDEEATLAPKLTREDGLVAWDRSAESICRQWRALDPWPRVVFEAACGSVRLLEVQVAKASSDGPCANRGVPGEVLSREGDAVLVACGRHSVLTVKRVQPAGRRPMTAAAACSGGFLSIGEILRNGSLGH